MNRKDKIEKEIREYWFKDHNAELIECGDITVLKWKKPNSGTYYVRYVFDGSKMYITGDIGDAVFDLTWKASIHSFDDCNLGYFLSKMTVCSNGKYEFDNEEAVNKLNIWKDKLLEENEFNNDDEREEFIEKINDLINDAGSCQGDEQWAWEYVNGEYNDFISENDCDYWEWIYEVGRVTPYHNYAYLIGLKMASEQLRNK